MVKLIEKRKNACGLVLSGGGARAAYQAGVLRGLAEIFSKRAESDSPFKIYSGESAGAVNCAIVCSNLENFTIATERLWAYWENIQFGDVFRVGPVAMLANTGKWIRELSFGGLFRSNESVSLLDATPLARFLKDKIQLDKIHHTIKKGDLSGIAISATNYATGTAISFFDGDYRIAPWVRTHRMGKRAKIRLEHVLASAAIPILFPPVKIGQSFYGDGSVRLRSPLSPAIHLGAERIFAIGARHLRSLDFIENENNHRKMKSITLSDIAGVLLNAGFIDNLDLDAERMERINHTIEFLPPSIRDGDLSHHLRKIPLFIMRPSKDLARAAWEEYDRLSPVLRYLLRGLGASRISGFDLISYLAFDRSYTTALLKMGYQDVMREETAVVAFFNSEL